MSLYCLPKEVLKTLCIKRGRHDTQHNDTQHSGTQHKDTQHNDIQHSIKKIQHSA
jgi:hypothetical protein